VRVERQLRIPPTSLNWQCLRGWLSIARQAFSGQYRAASSDLLVGCVASTSWGESYRLGRGCQPRFRWHRGVIADFTESPDESGFMTFLASAFHPVKWVNWGNFSDLRVLKTVSQLVI
jgi:hypothetical protein